MSPRVESIEATVFGVLGNGGVTRRFLLPYSPNCCYLVYMEGIIIAREHDNIVNRSIRAKEMRVISPDGEQLGVLSKEDALKAAEKFNLDLVLVSPGAKPPVARILDYGKFRYQQQRKAREQRKNQKTIKTQEIRLSPAIDDHDFETKLRQAKNIIDKGNKLRVSIRFKGRAITHKDLGREVLERFAKDMADVASVTQKPKMEGRSMQLMLAPSQDD